jgi:hypothetical protein
MGGLYFSWNALMSQVVLWGSIMLYIDRMGKKEEEKEASALNSSSSSSSSSEGELSEERLYLIGQVISAVWVVSVVMFFMSCNREYVGSFFDTATASTYAKKCWDWQQMQDPRVDDDVIVKMILKKHRDTYKDFEKEVSAFINENWEKWNHEKPKFFNKKFAKSIPLSMLCKEIKEEVTIGDQYEAESDGMRA